MYIWSTHTWKSFSNFLIYAPLYFFYVEKKNKKFCFRQWRSRIHIAASSLPPFHAIKKIWSVYFERFRIGIHRTKNLDRASPSSCCHVSTFAQRNRQTRINTRNGQRGDKKLDINTRKQLEGRERACRTRGGKRGKERGWKWMLPIVWSERASSVSLF